VGSANARRGRLLRRLLLGLAVGAAMTIGLVSCGSDKEEGGPATAAALGRLDPDEFATRMGDAGAQVINVHIPYEGELEHTDAFIPFHGIVGDAQLPADKDSEVLLYCMSGRMSETAGNALSQAGYTNVSHLEGGMKAWEAAGKPLIHKPQSDGSTGETH
jgi:rhodanese-related sulfurtransferase